MHLLLFLLLLILLSSLLLERVFFQIFGVCVSMLAERDRQEREEDLASCFYHLFYLFSLAPLFKAKLIHVFHQSLFIILVCTYCLPIEDFSSLFFEVVGQPRVSLGSFTWLLQEAKFVCNQLVSFFFLVQLGQQLQAMF